MKLGDAEVMLDAVADRGVVKLDSKGKVVQWSAGAQALFDYSEAEVLGRPVSMLHTDEYRTSGTAERELASIRDSDRIEFESWRVRKDGRPFRAGVVLSAIHDQRGSLTGFVEVVRDLAVDEQRAHSMFHSLLEGAPDAMVIVGPDGRIALANAQTDRMFGYPREELIGSAVEILLPPRRRDKKDIEFRTDFLVGPVSRPMGGDPDLWGIRRDGTEFPIDIGLSPLRIEGTLHVSVAIRDLTDHHKYQEQLRQQKDALIKAQRKLERLAFVDTLTGLVNHGETIARLEGELKNPRAPGPHLGVLYCDADHFKAINDTWGHTAGDVVLATLASRIRGCVRDNDTVGRVGGDEFLILLPGLHGLDEAVQIADKIRLRAAEPIRNRGKTIHATMSIGATLAVPGESVSAMTARVDAAIEKAKRSGRNTVNSI